MQACGGSIQTSVQNLTDDVLGRCEEFEEEQVGGERSVEFFCFVFFYVFLPLGKKPKGYCYELFPPSVR